MKNSEGTLTDSKISDNVEADGGCTDRHFHPSFCLWALRGQTHCLHYEQPFYY